MVCNFFSRGFLAGLAEGFSPTPALSAIVLFKTKCAHYKSAAKTLRGLVSACDMYACAGDTLALVDAGCGA